MPHPVPPHPLRRPPDRRPAPAPVRRPLNDVLALLLLGDVRAFERVLTPRHRSEP